MAAIIPPNGYKQAMLAHCFHTQMKQAEFSTVGIARASVEDGAVTAPRGDGNQIAGDDCAFPSTQPVNAFIVPAITSDTSPRSLGDCQAGRGTKGFLTAKRAQLTTRSMNTPSEDIRHNLCPRNGGKRRGREPIAVESVDDMGFKSLAEARFISTGAFCVPTPPPRNLLNAS
ncbi:unnamed protein product [Pleuronectes platessa]|uniref:Uncharacterized protein n=1 Tax=Pleuronectes platessa TaxID=8262 RepID=A0A9N7YZP1_PLEPL|nr:unnamed protein product [Pleuronectes platessa]